MTIEAGGQDTSDSRGTPVTTGAANTKGSWAEIIASTSISAEWITITLDSQENDQPFLVDIGVGAAAAESAVISNIPFTSNATTVKSFTLPLTIASGSRISARAQAVTSTRSIDVSVHLSDTASFGTSASNITLGSDTANSLGTVVDPGGAANTKGSWVELSSSTSDDIDLLAVFIGPNANAVIGVTGYFLVDIGIGAAASESVVIANIPYTQNSFEDPIYSPIIFFLNIPSGTRVAARAQSTEIDATDRLIDISIIGCNMTAPSGGGGGGQSHAGHFGRLG